MKKNLLSISILPLIIVTVFALSQPDKNNNGNKGNKGQSEQGNKGNSDKGNNDNNSKGKPDRDQGKAKRSDDRGQPQGKGNNGNKNQNENQNKNNDNNSKNNNSERFDGDKSKDKGNQNKGNKGDGKTKRETISLWDNRDIDWGFGNYANRKHPRKNKKVTICHQTGNDYPVNISVSENALQAHLNHGDQRGDCSVTYSDRWDRNYIETRQNVYNRYEETWENMSYSEALLKYAAERLLGVRTDLNTRRSSYSTTEVQRREALILDLQNNVNALENQLAVTEQRMGGININIQL